MTTGYRGNGVGGSVVTGPQIQPGAVDYTKLAAALQGVIGQGFRNRIINGVPFVRQRGDTFSVGGSWTYTHDRWLALAAGANFSLTVGQGPDGAPVCSYITGAAGNTLTSLQQRVEQVNCADFSVTGCTFSTRVYSSTARSVTATVYSPSATDNHAAQNVRATQTFAVPVGWSAIQLSAAASTEFNKGAAVIIAFGPCTAGQIVALTASQLESGSIGTAFEQRPVGLEMALCQRYYQRYSQLDSPGFGAQAAAYAAIDHLLPVTMRATPTLTFQDDQGTAGQVQYVSPNGSLLSRGVPQGANNSTSAHLLIWDTAATKAFMRAFVVQLNAEL